MRLATKYRRCKSRCELLIKEAEEREKQLKKEGKLL
jgi:hypothetical protein